MSDFPTLEAKTIDEVIQYLDEIIATSKNEKHPSRLGYFAALYNHVTKAIRDEVAKGKDSLFKDNARMERLDVLFANRYLASYSAWMQKGKPELCWEVSFLADGLWSPLVIQHLLAGMNAHIGLDLGIAAMQVCRELGEPIENLEADFKEINKILAKLTEVVEQELMGIWPILKTLVGLIPGDLEDRVVGFSMELAREAAWKLAVRTSKLSGDALKKEIRKRDRKVAKFGRKVTSPPWWIKLILIFGRVLERGNIPYKIAWLNGEYAFHPQEVLKKHLNTRRRST